MTASEIFAAVFAGLMLYGIVKLWRAVAGDDDNE